MAGGTVQESPQSGICLCNTKITCWEDLAPGAYTAGRVHGCLQALRFMLTWKYRRKVLCVVPDYRLRICTCCYGFQADSGILSRTVVPLNFAHACFLLQTECHGRNLWGIGCPVSSVRFLVLWKPCLLIILRLNSNCLVVPRPIEVWASIVSEFHVNLAQCVYGFTEQSNLYSVQHFVLENDRVRA